MYTRADNFTGTLLYEDLKEAYLHPDAMKSLKRAQRLLKEQYPGYSLIVYDAARPLSVQQKMWNVVKGTSKYIYVSNPSRGTGVHQVDGDAAVRFGDVDETEGVQVAGCPAFNRSRRDGCRYGVGVRDGGLRIWVLCLLWRLFSATTA